ncbi:hypothetical protein [Aurantimonas sp. 22II-16-19i]|uniref:hypothetical protein n=1 Tax=Aurantimonas sp. 22II-16-19i TaxID=1317114 RepID=UPI0009F82883|nr:hypothetical protein [Aurantimonas sp. 22II-16-19i]
MGAKPLSATQRQVTAILKGAAAAGVHVEIIAENGRVRFVPSDEPPKGSREVDKSEQGYL